MTRKPALFSANLYKKPKKYFYIRTSSCYGEQFWRQWGKKKSEILLTTSLRASPGSGTAAGNANFSTKSRFPLRAAVPSVRTSRTRSSCRARRGVRETDGTHRTRLLALLPRGCQSVCFVASDQPTRTGGTAPLAACEVGAAQVLPSRLSDSETGGGLCPGVDFQNKTAVGDR